MSNVKQIGINLSNLSPSDSYVYTFTNRGGNWPLKLSTISGVIRSSTPTHVIKSYVEFCPTVDACDPNDPNVFYNQPLEDNSGRVNADITNLYGVVGITVTSQNDNNIIVSHDTLVECDNCLPTLSITAPTYIFMTLSNSESATFTFNGLIPNQEYLYDFSIVDSNWPVKMSPHTGVIKSATSSYTFQSRATLCANALDCEDALPYNGTLNCDAGQTPFASLKLTLNPVVNSYQQSTSKEFTISCKNCFNQPTVQFNNPSITLNKDSKNKTSFGLFFNKLVFNKEYHYRITSIDANWPAVVTPMSGTIISYDPNGSESLSINLAFCDSPLICPSNNPDVIDYNLDSNCLSNYGYIDKFVRIRAELIDANCENITDTIYSNELLVNCVDCIPKVQITMPTSASLTNNNYTLNSSISNLIPGQKYKYLIDTVDSNWPTTVYPISGIFTPDSTSTSLSFQFSLCRSTGLCDLTSPNTLPYTLDDACLIFGAKDLRTTVKLNIETVDCDNPSSVTSNSLSLVCNNCLPTLRASAPTGIVLTSNNKASIGLTLSNLIPGQTYSYKGMGLSANWPVSLYPMSGNIVASGTSVTIPVAITVCKSSGICPSTDPTVIPYNLKTSSYYGSNVDRIARFYFDVNTVNCEVDETVRTNEILLTCDNCIPSVTLVNSPATASLTTAGATKYQLSTTAQNLVPGEKYTYDINYVDSNWPTIVSPRSGEFIAVSTSKVINTDLQFCFPSGSCAGNSDLMPYRNNTSSISKYTKINMSLKDSTCPLAPIRSEDFTLSCSNCFPIANYTIAWSGGSSLTLPLTCCTGTRVTRVDVGNAIASDIHTYEFSSSTPDISFVPSNGYVVIKPNGSGSIYTMMNSTLSSGVSALCQCKVTNVTSGLEAIEFSVVRCGTGC